MVRAQGTNVALLTGAACSKKVLLFCDLHFNVTGNVYGPDEREPASTAANSSTNLWSYYKHFMCL